MLNIWDKVDLFFVLVVIIRVVVLWRYRVGGWKVDVAWWMSKRLSWVVYR